MPLYYVTPVLISSSKNCHACTFTFWMCLLLLLWKLRWKTMSFRGERDCRSAVRSAESGSLRPVLAECREKAGWNVKVLLLRLGFPRHHRAGEGSLKGSLRFPTYSLRISFYGVVLNLPNAVAFWSCCGDTMLRWSTTIKLFCCYFITATLLLFWTVM